MNPRTKRLRRLRRKWGDARVETAGNRLSDRTVVDAPFEAARAGQALPVVDVESALRKFERPIALRGSSIPRRALRRAR